MIASRQTEVRSNPTTNQSFAIYSAARSDSRYYCLGLLERTRSYKADWLT